MKTENTHRILVNTCKEILDVVRTENEDMPVEYIKDLVNVMAQALNRINPPKQKALLKGESPQDGVGF